eukprot:maker-scaffold168_size293125-snap-gene-0.16 protein:Tk04446 transcript:maker-scaffold168_size293125-snap-gene-0.16-mRNA-1 annotation:"ubiquitin-like modifier activating enzyme 1 isoform x1"
MASSTSDSTGNPSESADLLVDENLYSRQLYVIGNEAQRRLQGSHVLVCGLDGLGLEVCKNLALSGVGAITLYDPMCASWSDLASNFYLCPEDADSQKSRSVGIQSRLSDLNKNCRVRVISTLEEEDIQDHDVITLCSVRQDPQSPKLISQWARVHEKIFVMGDVLGTVGYCFCDFGPNFTVLDPDGEEPIELDIISITNDASGTVLCLGEERHGLQDGDMVLFKDIQGMVELNEHRRVIEVTSPFAFTIGDTSDYTEYVAGGRCVQLKQPQTMIHESWGDSILEPQIEGSDWSLAPRRTDLIHAAIRCLYDLEASVENADDFETFHQAVNAAQTQGDDPDGELTEADVDLLARIFRSRRGQLGPICAFLGGILSQEIMKGCTGKFTPIQQWLYYDMLDCLPASQTQEQASGDEEEAETESESPEPGPPNRYLGQELVLGPKWQGELAQLRVFVVGSGAIGCELLKNLALMGVGSGDHGKITVTDPDRIEKSNLSRQFLFRTQDIGNNKAQVAANAIMAMNPDTHVEVFQERVGPETQTVFDEDFWQQFDVIANALDNVSARRYVDERCVQHEKPLLESGTLGTKGNVQVIIPHLTESYGASDDPPEKEVPMCTLKHYPFTLEHTLHWAKDLFHGLFERPSTLAEKFLVRGHPLDGSSEESVQLSDFLFCLSSHITNNAPKSEDDSEVGLEEGEEPREEQLMRLCSSPQDCVEWARGLWEQLFANEIKQITHIFPLDSLGSSGLPFWSPPKKCPQPLEFDWSEPTHRLFVESAAFLKARILGLESELSPLDIFEMIQSVQLEDFQPKADVSIPVDDSELATISPKTDEAIDQDAQALTALQASSPFSEICVIEFEKDDDSNRHMDFIFAAASIRARNYGIPPKDRQTAKRIAGRIIPALATTTSVVASLACMELYKIVLNQVHKKTGRRDSREAEKTSEEESEATPTIDYRNSFVNLALPLFAFSAPLAPKMLSRQWSEWDRLDFDGGLTLREIITHLERDHGILVIMLAHQTTLLYATFLSDEKRIVREEMTCKEAIETVSQKKVAESTKTLWIHAGVEDEDEQDVELPPLRITLREDLHEG